MGALSKDDDKKPFWKDEYQMYYANGEGMSDFIILKFKYIKGDYYENFKVEEFRY